MTITPEIKDLFRRILSESLEVAVQRRTLHAADLSHIARNRIRKMK